MPQSPGKPRKDDYGYVSPYRGKMIDKAEAKVKEFHKALKAHKPNEEGSAQKLGVASSRATRATAKHEELIGGMGEYKRNQANMRPQKAMRMK